MKTPDLIRFCFIGAAWLLLVIMLLRLGGADYALHAICGHSFGYHMSCAII